MNALAVAIEGFLSPLASALSNIVFFSVNLFGVQVPLVVAWLAAGSTLLHGVPWLR